ncbi:MAG: hypothetical protein KJN72_13250 [Woeseia sp.]|nr:hypothetical protein [Woeseia sp.]
MKTIIIAIGLSTLVLTGCGGGGGVSTPAPAPVADEKMGGVWVGTSTSGGNTHTLIGLSTDDGRFHFFTDDPRTAWELGTQFVGSIGNFAGSISVSNQNQISGSGVGAPTDCCGWNDGSVDTPVTVSGTLSEGDSITGSWSASTGENGTFNLTFDPIYNRTSSLAKVQGTYTTFDERFGDGGNAYSSITIDSNGSINGQDVDGCIWSGMVSIIDSNFNVYEITTTVSNCGDIDGTSTGLTGLFDNTGTDDMLWVSDSDGETAGYGDAYR